MPAYGNIDYDDNSEPATPRRTFLDQGVPRASGLPPPSRRVTSGPARRLSDSTMAETSLSTSLTERPPLFAGRAAELGALVAMLGADAPAIVWVYGLGGIGKSALLRAFAREAAARGADVLALDGETLEPTASAFRREICVAASSARLVVIIDAYERLRLLDDWLRRDGVPSLPAHARVVIAGRDAPVAAWTRDFGERLRRLPLDALPPQEALELLRDLGMDPEPAVRVNRALRGHPLALRLAASAPVSDERALQPALDELAREYLDDLEEPVRRALDAAGVVRRVTRPLLDVMVPDASDRFDALLGLPFVTRGRDGLIVHDVIRELLAVELRAADPVRHRRLRTAAWRHLRAELEAAAEHDLWRYTADMLYLVDNPAVRDAFFPASSPRYSIEPAGERDWPAIEAIGGRHEPAPGAVRAWWDFVPEAFFVARDAGGEVAGFSAVTEPGSLPVRLFDRDPVAAAWRRHLRGSPPARGERALLIRFMLSAESGERPALAQSALYLDVKRHYLALRPGLRRVYTCAHQLRAMEPVLRPLGFEPLDDNDGYRTYCNDFGPASVDGWLARLAAREVFGSSGVPIDEERRQLVLGDRRVDLGRLELGVLRCLYERPGGVVRRDVLLREVWGQRWNGDGNALEAVVSTLRRKLGDRAARLETVRGVGYRLLPLE